VDRNKQITIEVQDLTKSAPQSNLAAIIYYRPANRYIEISKDGTVRLISAAGTVRAQFKETEKRDLLRQSYIQMLISNGVQGKELEQALAAIERVDHRLNEEIDTEVSLTDLEQETQLQLRAWAKSQELDYEAMTEDEWLHQVQQGIAEVRKQETK
jgi:hypothetical protein